MKEDGNRLSFSIEKKNFVINNLLTGKLVINIHGQFTANNIDNNVVIDHLDNLQEALMTYKRVRPLLSKTSGLASENAISIRENDHLSWTVTCGNESANIKDQVITMSRRFDADFVLREINRVLAAIIAANKTTPTKANVIRKLSDVGMLVLKYKEHSAVVYEENCYDNMMYDCLIDGEFYQFAILMLNKDSGNVSVYTSNYEEIMQVPFDDSIRTYFPDLRG